MPSIAHVAISLLLLAFLSKITKGELNYRHAIIFSVNSWFGPDIFGWMPYYGPYSGIYFFIHGLGWPIVAFVIAIPWFYVNNAHLEWKPLKVSKRALNDKYYLPYLQVVCLVAGGGLFHLFVDIIGHPSYVYHPEADQVIPWGTVWLFSEDKYFSLEWILATGYFPCGNYFEFEPFYIFFGIAAPLLFIFAFFILPRNEGKQLLGLALFFYIIYTVILGISYLIPEIGGPWALTGGEADYGVLIYFAVFFFLPLLLLYWGYAGLPKSKKVEEINEKKE